MTLAALFLALIATPADVPSTATAGRGEPVLLDFHTEWCPPCKAMRPEINRLVQAGYPVKAVDGDRDRASVKRYGVKAFPTFIVVDGEGEVLARTEGYQPAADLAKLYKQAQAKVAHQELASRARAVPVSNRLDDEDEAPRARTVEAGDAVDDEKPTRKAPANPWPWETVVRIKMRLSNGYEGVGSGTIIYSDARESIILTCAHIFKEEGRKTPHPSQYRTPITVDLFDGQLSGPHKNQVHYTEESLRGEAIDYNLTNDVGLIRIRPGRVLPASKVVPPYWHPKEGMNDMMTVGCSEGREATAWSTKILRAKAGLKNTGTGETFHMMECEHAPMQGRSGGGIFTKDGYLAGVCDFADPQHGHGLYAVPESIYALLDRNKLTALYDPKTRNRGDSEALLAKGPARPKRASEGGVYRGQSPTEEEASIPRPEMLGVKPPELVSDDTAPRRPATAKPWRISTRRPPTSSEPTEAIPAEMSRVNTDELPAPPPALGADEVSNPDDVPPRGPNGTPTKWRPVRRD